MSFNKYYVGAAVLPFFIAACAVNANPGVADEEATGSTAQAQQIPSFPQDLLDEHMAWHMNDPSSGGRPHGMGTPGSGYDFLSFHRDFMHRALAWYFTQPGADADAVHRWTSIPDELKSDTRVGWNAQLAAAEKRIITNSPPFASADELGIFIETTVHNWIHGATATHYNDPTVKPLSSPQSTYFYKIHGLVDFWWSQWLTNKDYNHDGKADILWHHRKTGQVDIWTVDDLVRTGGIDVNLLVTGSAWQIVGTGDFTGDGQTDILWRHSPTGQVHLWRMNGTTRVEGININPAVSDLNWQVEGTGDFDGDGQLDILWRHTDGTVHVWTMNGTTRTNGINIDATVPDGRWQIKGTGDFDGDRNTDILWHNYTTGEVHIWRMDKLHRIEGIDVNLKITDLQWNIAGTGDFNNDGWLDILWQNETTGQPHVWTMNGLTRTSGTNVGPAVSDLEWQIVGDGKPRFPTTNDTERGFLP